MKRKTIMGKRGLLLLILSVMLILTTAHAKESEGGTPADELPTLTITKKEGADFDRYTESQLRLLGSMVGEFVLDGFKGQEDLRLPDTMKKLYVDNEEMYYVVRRQQYLIDALKVMGGSPIHDLRFLETILMDVQQLSEVRVQIKAYIRLAFRYLDDPEQRQSGVGQEILATLLKVGDEQYRIENFKELSSEYDSMKDDYHFFCGSAAQKGITDTRKLVNLYFSDRIAVLEKCKDYEKTALEGQAEGDEVNDDIRIIRPISGSF